MSRFSMPRTTFPRRHGSQGIILPIAMIMLAIISFVGLMSARNSASYEQFSNNIRTSQVARQAAEAGLRYCERVAIDDADNEGKGYPVDAAKIISDIKLATPEESTAAWNSKANWKTGAANLIAVSLGYTNEVRDASQIRHDPTCIIQALADDGYLITARGLSNDAKVDSNTGELETGSEVWLQSILKPGVPNISIAGGNE